MNFVPAVACHFYQTLPTAFTQPGARLLAEPRKGGKNENISIPLQLEWLSDSVQDAEDACMSAHSRNLWMYSAVGLLCKVLDFVQ